nr:degenerin deg-1-like [Parasteatoda tepidariorum]
MILRMRAPGDKFLRHTRSAGIVPNFVTTFASFPSLRLYNLWYRNASLGSFYVLPTRNLAVQSLCGRFGTTFYSFSVFPHAEEYPQYWGVVSAQLSIHSPRQIVNPFTDGFNMNLNTEQTFRLKKVVKKLLPAPYETNCIDYIEMWKKRGGHGPTNQKECFEECQKNISIQFRGCVSSYYNFPRNERTCSSTESAVEVPKSVIAECEKQNCKPACYEESYEVTREVTEKYIRPECSLEKAPDQSIDIEIRMNGMETTTYTYSPKFESVEIFSYIGGYIGIWLGVSLVAAFDFLETTILIMSYPVKNYKEKRKRNRNIETIKKPSMNL